MGEDTTNDTLDPDLNLTQEIDEAASKAAKAAFDLLRKEDDAEKVTRIEVEKENLLKIAVENSGAKAAGNEYERLKTGEQTFDGSVEGEIEGIDIMEEAGRAAAHEEYVKMKSMEEAIKKASKLRTDDEITLLNEVRDAARKAAKEIFVSINMAEKDNDPDEEKEQKLLERAGQEAADSHYNIYIAEISRKMENSKDNLKDTDVMEFYKNTAECEEFELRIEETSRNAVIEEFNKLKKEAKIEHIEQDDLNVDLKTSKNKKDIVQKFKYRVEEAARDAARETYTLMKTQDEVVTEENDIEKERTEQLLLDEVLKAGITAAECEYDKQKESGGDTAIEVDEDRRLKAAQRG